MAVSKFKITLQNLAGDYYYATQDIATGQWTVLTDSTERAIQHLPDNWDKMKLTWGRNQTYHGVFRSQSGTFEFTEDARGILLFLYSVRNIQAYCKMSVWYLPEVESSPGALDFWTYKLFYESEIDFSTFEDNKQTRKLSVSTLDNRLFQLLKANASKSFNIPFWYYDPVFGWQTDAKFIYHDGLKVLFKTQFTSGAAGYHFDGWHGGDHGFHEGQHCIPAMNSYPVVQNNGSTTYIGNTILEPLLPTSNQNFTQNEVNFNDESRPFTNNNYLLKNLLGTIQMNVVVSGQFASDIVRFDASNDYTLKFVLFEIDDDNEPNILFGQYQVFATLLTITMPAGSGTYTPFPASGGAFTSSATPVTLNANKIYVLGIIFDGVGFNAGFGNDVAFNLGNLNVSFESQYNSGTGAPLLAPRFPASTTIAYRAYQVFEKIVNVINSTETDPYGFPVPASHIYTSKSDYMIDSGANREDDFDLKAYNLMFTSENAIKNINGQQYINISLATFFNTMSKICGLGLGIEYDNAIGDYIIRMEKMEYFYDSSTEILALGTDIVDFKITPLDNLRGDNIKTGYAPPATNNNFGVDSFNIPTEYATETINANRDIDLAATSVVVDQSTIELARSQRNTSSQSNPSSGNTCILLDTTDAVAAIEDFPKPDGSIVAVSAYGLQKYPSAQSTAPGSADYIRGLYYPESAINLSITPASNTRRCGPMLRSICHGTGVIIFRKQYEMLYNNTAVSLPGIEKNLHAGLITEVADIALADLPPKLFRPEIFTVTSRYPVNMFDLLKECPRGYVSFINTNREGISTLYKGFIWEVSQNNELSATVFTLLAHPDTTNAQIAAA